jgi:hypothetical protein
MPEEVMSRLSLWPARTAGLLQNAPMSLEPDAELMQLIDRVAQRDEAALKSL